jgi:regulator of chromosome condensation
MSPIKRSAEDDLVDDSTRKRGKIDVNTDNNDSTKPQKKPFNPLLDETPPVRPACHLFVFGNGDSGQFGLGPDSLGDALRPKIHKWTEDAMAEGKLGDDGGGLAKICAGGMHTLALDESGKVSNGVLLI